MGLGYTDGAIQVGVGTRGVKLGVGYKVYYFLGYGGYAGLLLPWRTKQLLYGVDVHFALGVVQTDLGFYMGRPQELGRKMSWTNDYMTVQPDIGIGLGVY